MKKIKYLSHYDVLPSSQNRFISSPAAVNKQDYIFKVLSELGIQTTVISACGSREPISYPACEKEVYPGITLKLLPTLKCKGKISRIIAVIVFRFRLMMSLLREVQNGDTLFVYHSLSLMKFIKILKIFRKFKLVIDIEEIYGDVLQDGKIVKQELKFFELADGYLFPTELLEKKLNAENKPYAVVYGTYNVEEDLNCSFDDDKIHIVYAGTLDPRKGGAGASVATGEFLDSRYHMHILGFGTDADREHLCKEIERVSEKSKCKVTYDGCLAGNEYIRFLQSCDIGLSTQNPSGAFNDTSFPSKILSYMANGLRVVSIRISAIEASGIGGYM